MVLMFAPSAKYITPSLLIAIPKEKKQQQAVSDINKSCLNVKYMTKSK